MLKILKRTFRGTKTLFCDGGLNLFFSPRRYQLQNNTSSTVIFSAQFPKRYYKISSCGLFEAEHPKRQQNHFIIPRGYNEHPRHFYMGSSPPPPTGHKPQLETPSICLVIRKLVKKQSSRRGFLSICVYLFLCMFCFASVLL